jgi:hypothetical protein
MAGFPLRLIWLTASFPVRVGSLLTVPKTVGHRPAATLAILAPVSIQRPVNVQSTSLMTCLVLLGQANCLAAYSAETTPTFREAWRTLSIVEYWGPCPSSDAGDCTRSWTIGADSTGVKVQKEGKTFSTQLNSVDLNAIKAIVGSSEFQRKLESGFDCPPAPTDFYRTIMVAYAGDAQTRFIVTGCDKNTLPGKLSDILSRY